MEHSDLIRFNQLYKIAFSNSESLKSNCSDELKRHLIEVCEKIDPSNSYGCSIYRRVTLNANLVTSLYRKYFS